MLATVCLVHAFNKLVLFAMFTTGENIAFVTVAFTNLAICMIGSRNEKSANLEFLSICVLASLLSLDKIDADQHQQTEQQEEPLHGDWSASCMKIIIKVCH